MSWKFASFIKPNIILFTLFTITKIVEKPYYVALPSLSVETKKQKSLVNSNSIIYDLILNVNFCRLPVTSSCL